MTRIDIQKLQKIIKDQAFVIKVQDKELKRLHRIESDCEFVKGRLIAISKVVESWND